MKRRALRPHGDWKLLERQQPLLATRTQEKPVKPGRFAPPGTIYGEQAPHDAVLRALTFGREPVSGRVVAERIGAPEHVVMRALHALRQQGLVNGKRMPNGNRGLRMGWTLSARGQQAQAEPF